jgi:hypothetical protein
MQKSGLYAVSLIVPAGIFTGDDLREVAELSRSYGSGEIRLSVYQNLYKDALVLMCQRVWPARCGRFGLCGHKDKGER